MILENEIALGGAAAPVGYQIERSLRFNSPDSAYLSWTPPQAGNRRIWTFSAWVKRGALDTDQFIFDSSLASNETSIAFNTANQLNIYAAVAGSVVVNLLTTQVFRDVGSSMSIQVVVDTTQATAANRVKLYINGVQVTVFSTSTYCAQNTELIINSVNAHSIGRNTFGANRYASALLSEINFVDGQALDPTSFGEFNASTGVWSPLAYTGNYGNNGFYLPFNDNSTVANLGRNRQPLTTDPYFPVTTLLLNGNGTNGANNNTFLDSSSNNFSITRNGNTAQGTFSPFSLAGWGVKNTISQYCQLNNADFAISTGDFTIDFWMYCEDDSTYSATNICSAPSNPNFTLGFGSGSAGSRQLYLEYGGGATTGIGSSMSNYINRWTHIAVVRQSGTVTAYQNGISLGSVSKAAAVGSTANLFLLRNSGDTAQDFRGYVSNLRICKSAVYTSNFTPSTAPLTTTSQGATNCVLLTFQDNRFKDNSATAATVTPTNTAILPFTPFAPTVAYSAATHGGSGSFDGNGDALVIASNAAFAFGTGDFSIEFWLYPTTATGQRNITFPTVGAPICYMNTSRQLVFENFGSTPTTNTTNTLNLFAWNHCVASRVSGTTKLFINGVEGVSTTAFSATNFIQSSLNIGTDNGTNYTNGYISGVRIVKGSGVTSVTVPTAPPTAITNTQLLLNFTNAGIIDATGKSNWETVGNVQISTAQKKWGSSSIYFPGTSANQKLLPSQNYLYDIFGTGDFTLECQLYVISQGATTVSGLWDQRPGVNGTYINWVVDFGGYGQGSTSNPKLVLYTNSAALCVSGVLTMGAWNHVALCRANGTTRMFINGVLSGSAVADSNNYLGGGSAGNFRPSIGSTDGGDSLYGYIQDFRPSRFARYTGNFTPPTAQFAYNQADINVNQWIANNFSVTAGAGNDSLVDSPTNYGTDSGVGGQVRGNYCTLNPLDKGSDWTAVTNGNLEGTVQGPNGHSIRSTMAVSSGKWYWEFTNVNNLSCGIIKSELKIVPATGSLWVGSDGFGAGGSFGYRPDNGNKTTNSTGTAYGATFTTTDVIGCALDMDNGKIYWSKNGVWQASGDPAAGTNAAYTGLSGTFSPAWGYINAGANTLTVNFGQRPFAYTAPPGFKALCTQNLPTPAIGATSSTLASKNFDVVTYTGTNTTNNIAGLGFQPDLVWPKSRSNIVAHSLFDAVRGARKVLSSNRTDAEGSEAAGASLTAFNSNGFTLGTDNATIGSSNASGYTYAAWSWKGGNGTVSNTDGSRTSTVSANPAAGISIASFSTVTSGTSSTVGHGLGAVPKMIITKYRNAANNWVVHHAALGTGYTLQLNTTSGQITNTTNIIATSSSTFTLGTSFVDNPTQPVIAYCFAEVAGFSKFGSYTGNGSSTDGPFAYCGFRPRYVMIKRTDTTSNWSIYDTARDTYNDSSALLLYPNLTAAETPLARDIDILSNGFKCRSNDSDTNALNGTYIFAAFAEAPFNYARAR